MNQLTNKELGLPTTEAQEENSNTQVSGDDKLSEPLIDVEEARRELLTLVEVNDEEEALAKRIPILVARSERHPINCDIYPDTTARELLSELNLQGYVLFPLPNADQEKTVSRLRSVINFKDDEDLYRLLDENDRLIAIPASEAQAYILQIILARF